MYVCTCDRCIEICAAFLKLIKLAGPQVCNSGDRRHRLCRGDLARHQREARHFCFGAAFVAMGLFDVVLADGDVVNFDGPFVSALAPVGRCLPAMPS